MARKRTARSIALSIDRSYIQARVKIEQAMTKCEPGSAAYLNHSKALYELGQSWRDERARRGLDPVLLGAVTKARFDMRAEVDITPAFETAEDRRIRQQLDEEFGDGKPAAVFNKDDDEGAGPASAPAVPPAPPAKGREKS